MTERELINSFITDILDKNKRIIVLIGSGMSLNSSKIELKNGIGSTIYFENKFIELLNDSFDTSSKKELETIMNDVENSDNHYSRLAEIIRQKDKNWKRINNIFKKEIIPILGNELSIDDTNDFIEKTLRKKEVCERISLNLGFEAFGKLAKYLSNKTKIFTSNFDPFIEVTLRKNDVNFLQLHSSHNLEKRREISLSKQVITVEHYHGYWLNDTAHINLEDRRHNIDAFKKIIKEHDSLYVFGFGGWKDAFSEAILETIKDTTYSCQFHWAFYGNENDTKTRIRSSNTPFQLLNQITLNNEKCSDYYNINTNTFFPKSLTAIRKKIVENALKNYKNDKLQELTTKGINKIFQKLPYKYGKLDNRDKDGDKKISKFILEQIGLENNVIVCSKFGLGKTTILENVFLEYVNSQRLNYSVLINLAYHELSTLVNNAKSVSQIIYDELRLGETPNEVEELLKLIEEYLHNKDLLLLLDSIDESIYKDEELKQFRSKIINLDFPIIASIRLEFHEFIDNAKEFENWKYIAVEIKEWKAEQLKEYMSSISDNSRIYEKILKLNKLNKRPLFVSLLNRLNPNNLKNLEDNIADLYFTTISQSLDAEIDVIYPNATESTKSEVKREYRDLLNSIAIAIYLEFQHYKFETNYKSKPRVTFNYDNIRLLVSKNKYLDFEQTKLLFETNAIDNVKIIRKIKQKETKCTEFTFFHRSFFEYLVANGAAVRIIRDNKCSEAWDVYQTDEVSDYFVSEVSRENVETSLTKKGNFFNAFEFELIDLENMLQNWEIQPENEYTDKKVFSIRKKIKSSTLLTNPLIHYTERLEEVLYYIGKFKSFWNEKQKITFENCCKFIFYNARIVYQNSEQKIKPAIDPIYYRTSSITLSRLKDNNFYIYNYISYLISDYSTVNKFFYFTQIRKDTTYYGKEQLFEKCQKAYNEIFNIQNEDDLKPLQILKIFSLFISVWYNNEGKDNNPIAIVNQQKLLEIKLLFNNLKKYCNDNHFLNVMDMLEGLHYIINDITFPIFYKQIDLKNLLKIAINKRSNFKETSIFRLVNSNGDNLNYLEIDYYKGHIVIEAKKIEYVTNQSIIIETLKEELEKLNIEIVSISLKHNIDFELGSKNKGENYILLDGSFNEEIDCEDYIKLKIKPKNFPKTGFFIDNRKIRKYISENSEGKNILNLCSFTCSLGAIAKKNGAINVINLDKEEKFIELGKRIYNSQSPKLNYEETEFLCKDLRLFIKEKPKEKFDIVILDLAEYAPIPCNFKNVEDYYLETNKSVLHFLKEDGILITSCCSHGFSRSRFNKVIDKITKDNEYTLVTGLNLDQLDDHPIKPDDIYSDYLKISVIKKESTGANKV